MRRWLFFLLVLSCSSQTGTETPQNGNPNKPDKLSCDMSSDDAVRKVYTSLTKKELSKDGSCIDRPSSFPEVARVGSLIPDLGCQYDIYIIKCEVAGPDMRARAMASAGWPTATQEKKQHLALDWLSQLNNLHPLTPDDVEVVDHFKKQGQTLSPPEFEATADGGLKVRYWTGTGNGGMTITTEIRYDRHETTFDKDGVEQPGAILSSFTYKLKGSE